MHGTFPITRSVPEATALAAEIAKLYPMADIPYCGLASRNMADVFLVRDGTTQFAHLSSNGLSVVTPEIGCPNKLVDLEQSQAQVRHELSAQNPIY